MGLVLLHVDGFDHFNSSRMPKKYSFTGFGGYGSDNPAGRYGLWGFNIFNTGFGTVEFRKILGVQASTFIIGFDVKPTNGLPGEAYAESQFLNIRDNVGVQISLAIRNTGKVQVWKGGGFFNFSGTLLAESADKLVSTFGDWAHLEFKLTFPVGWELRREGVLWMSGNDNIVGSSASWTDRFDIRWENFGQLGIAFDNMYALDGNGSFNNDFLGKCIVDTAFPIADGIEVASDWTPNSGSTSWTQLDEKIDVVPNVAPDDDTTYIAASIVNLEDYIRVNTPSFRSDVRGLSLTSAARSFSGLPEIAYAIYLSGTKYYATAFTPGASSDYAIHQDLFELNPSTLAQWLDTQWTSGRFGVKYNAGSGTSRVTQIVVERLARLASANTGAKYTSEIR